MGIKDVTDLGIRGYSETDQSFLKELLEADYIPSHCHNREGRCYFYKSQAQKDQPETMEAYERMCKVICDCEIICSYEYEHYQTAADESGSNLNVLREIKLIFPEELGKPPVITEITPDDLSSKNKLQTFLLSKGASGFRGSQRAHEALLEFLITLQQPNRVRVYRHWGEIKSGVFLYQDGVLNANTGDRFHAKGGEIKYEYDDHWYKVKGILDHKEMSPPTLFHDFQDDFENIDIARTHFNAFVDQWIQVNGRFKVGIYLGFITASLFKEKIIHETNIKGFPMLFNFGRYGLGKSDIMKMLLAFYGIGKDSAMSMKGSTPVGIMRSLAKMNTFPLLLDDYRNDHWGKESLIDQKMLNWYHNISDKSGMKTTDNSTFSTPMKATLLFTGNEKPLDLAVLSRLIILEFTGKDKSSQKREAIDRLQELAWISPHVFPNMFKITPIEHAFGFLMGRYQQWATRIDDAVSEKRYVQNYALVLAGLDQLNELYGLSVKSEELVGECIDHIKRRLRDQVENDPLNQFLSGIDQYVSRTRNVGHRIDQRHMRVIFESELKSLSSFKESFNRGLAIYFNDVWDVLKDVDHDVIRLGKQKVKNALESSDLLLKTGHQTTLAEHMNGDGNRNVRCICLNLDKLLMNEEFVTLKQYVDRD